MVGGEDGQHAIGSLGVYRQGERLGTMHDAQGCLVYVLLFVVSFVIIIVDDDAVLLVVVTVVLILCVCVWPLVSVCQVVSNRMQKSVLVAIDRIKTVKKYRTTVKRTTKLMVRGRSAAVGRVVVVVVTKLATSARWV